MRSARPLHLLAAAALGLGLGLPTTAAATSISLDPAAQTAHVGDVVSVEVVFDGLAGEIVSAYDLAVADAYATTVDVPPVVDAPGVLANDLDPDGESITFASIMRPAHGTITSAVTNGSFI